VGRKRNDEMVPDEQPAYDSGMFSVPNLEGETVTESSDTATVLAEQPGKAGDIVLMHEGDSHTGAPRVYPAMLIERSQTTGKWHLNVHKSNGMVVGRRDVAFSETPLGRHWTFRGE
jgi:hypothetical protein